jgi:methylamine dehydrogenase accessory protein MauD
MGNNVIPEDYKKQGNIVVNVIPFLLIFVVFLQTAGLVVLLFEVRSLRADIGILTTAGSSTVNSNEGLPAGANAPSFNLKDTGGKTVALSDSSVNGRLLLIFTSPTCHYCDELYPELKKYTDSELSKGLAIRMLSLGTVAQNQEIKSKQGFKFTILAATEKVFTDYRVPGTPFFVLINPNGQVVKAGSANNAEQIASFVGS